MATMLLGSRVVSDENGERSGRRRSHKDGTDVDREQAGCFSASDEGLWDSSFQCNCVVRSTAAVCFNGAGGGGVKQIASDVGIGERNGHCLVIRNGERFVVNKG